MPDFKQTFQEEVRRLARKELKAFEAKINEQKKTISALQKRVNELEKKLTDLIDYVYSIGAKEGIDYINKVIYKIGEDGTYRDEVDGYHSPGDCYNPNGYYCGDCTKRSCAHCDNRFFVDLEEGE